MPTQNWLNSVHCGDCRETLADMPESSIHMCMTSPPYFGLRDYGHEDQIGLEDTLDEFISEIVDVGQQLKRVLRNDGSWWLNLGDTYAQSGRSNHDKDGTAPDGQGHERGHEPGAFGSKNKMLVPHRVAIALQEDGWVVRNDVTWVKPNPMPQSVKDRLNTTTEQIFHLTPEPDYWYDLDAIREPHAERSVERANNDAPTYAYSREADAETTMRNDLDEDMDYHVAGKNPGDVFEVTTKPFPDAHFAVYPPELCEKPIKATCPPKVCAACGSPYERDVERETVYDHDTTESTKLDRDRNDTDGGNGHDLRNGVYSSGEFKGWEQACDCDTDATEPGIALDPFAGAGTTLLKAKDLGRRFVGIELNAEYADMARARIGLAPEDPSVVRDHADQQGFEAYTDGGKES